MTGNGNRWWLVVGAGLAVFMVALDSSIVNVALPTIGRAFQSPAAVIQWTILGYLLPAVALVLPAGRWLDRNGQRPAFLLAVAGFAASSAAAGAAPGIGWLIAARVIQGVFGALLSALFPALVSGAVQPQVRARAMSVVATLGPLGAVTGPAIGGFLISTEGWPWIFYVNVPVSLGVIAIGLRTLDSGGGLRLPDRGWLAESVLLAVASAVLLGALTQAPLRGMVWLLAAIAAVPLVAAWSRLPSSRPVAELLRAPGIAGPLLSLLLNVAGIAGAGFIAPFYLQQALHVGSATTGLVVLTLPLGMAATSTLGGYLADRWGARQMTVVGTLVIATGLVLAAPLAGSWRPIDLGWRLAIIGVGLGLFAGRNMAVAMQQAPRHLLATTGATTSLARSLAFALGPAVATIPWSLSAYSQSGMRQAVALCAGVAALSALVKGVSAILGRRARAGAVSEGEKRAA